MKNRKRCVQLFNFSSSLKVGCALTRTKKKLEVLEERSAKYICHLSYTIKVRECAVNVLNKWAHRQFLSKIFLKLTRHGTFADSSPAKKILDRHVLFLEFLLPHLFPR